MADQEFLASFAVEIDEQGVSRLQQVLEENRELADRLASAFSSASQAMRQFAADLGEALPSLFPLAGHGITTEGLIGTGGLALGLDLTQAQADLKAFTELLKKPVSLSASASSILSTARTAYNSVRSIFASPVPLNIRVETGSGDNGSPSSSGSGSTPSGSGSTTSRSSPVLKMSAGGRFTRPTSVQVAEDGDAEYIIPVRKEDRALPLLRRLLGELSPAARESLSGSGGMPSFSGGLSAGESAGSVTVYNQHLSAPVNIHVTASGGRAEEIGRSIYDTAERYLLRTLRSSFPL